MTLSPEVKAYFSAIGRKNGNALMEKHGSQYFRDIAAKRKRHGKQVLPVEKDEQQDTVSPEENR